MIEEPLTPEQRTALDAIKRSRGECPSAETLVAYEALDAAAREKHAAHDHIQICARCQLVLLHVAEPASQMGSRLRWALPIAALLIVGVAVTMVMRSGGPPVEPVETVRGTEIQAIAPIGNVDTITEFAWQSPARLDHYRVIVFRSGSVVWQTETRTTRVAPPRDAIPMTAELRWIVEGIDREGVVRMTSPPQSFTWIPRDR